MGEASNGLSGTDATKSRRTPSQPGIGGRFMAQWAKLDNLLNRWARNWAKACPDWLLPTIILFLGSLVLAWVALPGGIFLRFRHFIDCWSPYFGPAFTANCAEAPQWVAVPFLTILALVLMGLLYVLSRLFVTFSSRIVGSTLDPVEPARPCTVLIMGLSSLPPRVTADDAIREAAAWSDPQRRWIYAGPAKDLAQLNDTNAPLVAAGWQQAARMTAAHLSRVERNPQDWLKTIYVLPSHETRPLIEPFKTYLTTLFGRPIKVELVTTEDGDEFEDQSAAAGRARRSYDNYAYLWNGLRRAIALAREKHPKIKDSDICVDATAGLKLFSIAAAVVTLDSDILLSYVVSRGGDVGNPDEGVVRLFDPRLDFLGAARRKIAQSYLGQA